MQYEFEPFSWFDKNGRLLKTPGEPEYVYRAISAEALQIFTELERGGCLPSLFALGLVETELSSMQVDDYAGVLQHKRIPFISEPNEWTMRMLKEAGIVICNLAIELDKLGYGLQDAHPWNVAFEGTRPIFFDWGSIIRKSEVSKRAWLSEFRKQIFMPLWLFSKGLRTLAYESLWERRGGSAKYLFNHRYIRPFPLPYARLIRQIESADFGQTVEQVLQLLEQLSVSDPPQFWSDYSQHSYPYKDKAFQEFLGGLPAQSSVLDLGCNKGFYSLECSKAGHSVVAFDYDAKAVDDLYHTAKQQDQNIVPLRIDVVRPTHAYGPDLSSLNIFERLRCDYAMAFAVSHHFAKNHSIPFESFAKILDKYARKGVLVEYVDLQDTHLQGWQKRGWQPPAWYSEQQFVGAFSKMFRLKKRWQTDDGEQIVRRLFLFER